MSTRRLLAVLAILAATLVAPLAAPGTSSAAESLSVNLAAPTKAATGVGEGFLYGTTLDASQPADQFVQPLGITAFRGGGHASGGWIADGYTYGSATKADVNSAIAQARRFTQTPYHAQYQVILSDVYGADGGQPSSTVWPCASGNCANWISFIDSVVGALQNSGLPIAYDVWNEPDISLFWPNASVNSTQYFQMWDSAVTEIRRIAPSATIVGPSLAYTPQRNAGEWQTWLAHTKSAGTLPDMITNHDEGDVDDPVAVAQSINSALSANGIAARPLSANEYQPSDRQTAGVTAWYLARFAQSGYANAMRGNWVCCTTPNLTGVLTQSNGSWTTTGNWWAMRSYAGLTGNLVSTSGQVGSTAISASVDNGNKRAVAILGDSNGYTGSASVTFSGLSALSWLSGGSVTVTVDRIPDQAPLAAPQVVTSQIMSTSSGSITVPVTFQAAHDAFAIYLTPTVSSTGGQLVHAVGAGRCLDVPNGSDTAGTQLEIWDCNGQSNQFFTRTSANQLTVYTGSAQMCLDAYNNQTTAGTKVDIWPCNGGANQQWQVNSNGTITGTQSGLCLDVSGAGTGNGALVELWTCNGASNQHWTLG